MAIRRGFEELRGVEYDFIGNLDADLTFEREYFERLLAKFEADPKLGIGGGFIQERDRDGAFRNRAFNTDRSVGHAVQMVRRECYEQIGGWVPMPYGGQDWQALVAAEMRGWSVRAFPDLPVGHLRPTGGGDRRLRNLFREGRMDYSVGSDPLFELFKLARRFRVKPYVLGSFVRLSGFLSGYWTREERPVSDDFVTFLRRSQRAALRALFRPGSAIGTFPVCKEMNGTPPAEVASGEPPVRHRA